MNLDKVLVVFHRLRALLEQYDSAEKSLAELEMQNEMLFRIPGEANKELDQAKNITNKALKDVVKQTDAARRALEEISGLSPADLRERLSEISVAIEQSGTYALEHRKHKAEFEVLVVSEAFEDNESRAEYESRLSSIRKLADAHFSRLISLVGKTINRKSVVVPNDSVIKQLLQEGTLPSGEPKNASLILTR